mgnify:CR=1 FL=1
MDAWYYILCLSFFDKYTIARMNNYVLVLETFAQYKIKKKDYYVGVYANRLNKFKLSKNILKHMQIMT